MRYNFFASVLLMSCMSCAIYAGGGKPNSTPLGLYNSGYTHVQKKSSKQSVRSNALMMATAGASYAFVLKKLLSTQGK